MRTSAKTVRQLQKICNLRQQKIMKHTRFFFFAAGCDNLICGKASISIVYITIRLVKKIRQVFWIGGSFFFLINVRPWIPGCRYSSRPAVLLALVSSETLSAFLKRRLRVPGLVKYSRSIRKSSWQYTIKFASKGNALQNISVSQSSLKTLILK